MTAFKHYHIRTKSQYVHWVKRFIVFHGKRHPKDMGAAEVEAFLSHFSVTGNVAASPQNHALSALSFLNRDVLGVDLPWIGEVIRAKPPARLPAVLTQRDWFCCWTAFPRLMD